MTAIWWRAKLVCLAWLAVWRARAPARFSRFSLGGRPRLRVRAVLRGGLAYLQASLVVASGGAAAMHFSLTLRASPKRETLCHYVHVLLLFIVRVSPVCPPSFVISIQPARGSGAGEGGRSSARDHSARRSERCVCWCVYVCARAARQPATHFGNLTAQTSTLCGARGRRGPPGGRRAAPCRAP